MQTKPALEPYHDNFDWTDAANNVLVARWPELCDMVAMAIVPALDRLIDDPAGYPTALTEERWDEILVKIRSGFAAHNALAGHTVSPEERAQVEAVRDEGLALFAEHFASLWS